MRRVYVLADVAEL